MRDLKQTGFNDRITAQQDAKKALLARFKPKAAAPDPEFDKLAEKRAAEKEAQRQQHELRRLNCVAKRPRRKRLASPLKTTPRKKSTPPSAPPARSASS